MKKLVLSVISLLVVGSPLFAGPYTGGTIGTAWNSPAVQEWADQVDSLTRGPVDIQNPTGALATFGTASQALGQSNALQSSGNVVSLGDGGSIVLSFAQPIGNGPGPDLSVFENGFASGSGGLGFLELGFVSVSSDGTDFFTFPSVSLTQTTTQVGGFGTLDPTNIYDLAGKTFAGVGTDFDLSELAGVSPLLNVNDVQYVKVTDVIGDINPLYASHDSLGNIINDPYSTPFPSGGFDLDAVAVLNIGAAPEPCTWALTAVGLALLAWRIRRTRTAALVAALAMTGFAHADNIDFSSLTPTTPYNPPGNGDYTNDQAFSVQDIDFNNSYDPAYDSWAGFAYSNTNDQTTSSYGNQYSAAGAGIPTFAIGYVDDFTPFDPAITLPAGEQPLSLTLTNNVYAELSMENGDEFAKKFGPGDYFILTISGYNSAGNSTGSVPFYLANFLSSDPAKDYIVQNWTTVNLSSLAPGTDKLVFTESSSDTGEFGINTPEYFALGGLDVAEAPEPSACLFLLAGLGLLFFFQGSRA